MRALRTLSFLVITASLGCGGAVTQNTSQQGGDLSNGADKAGGGSRHVMCMWMAYGKRQYTCTTGQAAEAQLRCDKLATDMRKEAATCSCSVDPEYIRDMCDGPVPVTGEWTRR